MALKNLIGQQFGKLIVIEQAPSSKRGREWKCLCACGNYTVVCTTALNSGKTQSCGCLQKEKAKQRMQNYKFHNGGRQGEDLSNQHFGKLIALEPTLERNNGSIVWKCQCECGNIVFVSARNLKSKNTQSCGCILSFGEARIAMILQQNNINYIKEYNVKINNQNRRFDFAIVENNKITRLIEFDGTQHQQKGTGYYQKSFKQIQQRDKEKNEWALNNNIPLVRIPYKLRDTVTLTDLKSDTYLVNIDT